MLIENHAGMTVAGEAGSRTDAIAAAEREKPDIILLDLDMGGDSSLNFIREILSVAEGARVIILTGVRDPDMHSRAMRLGAMGLVLKEKAAEVLIKAIERVYEGEAWMDRSMMASMLTEMSRAASARRDDPEAAKIASLTEREREIIKLVCQGLKNKQIAELLFISEATVRNHLTSILSKLDTSDRFELAIYSYRHGLAEPPR